MLPESEGPQHAINIMKTNRIILALTGLALVSSLRLQAQTNVIYYDPFTTTAGRKRLIVCSTQP